MTCAKKRVFCTIIAQDGTKFMGENYCDNAQPSCPRLPNEGYEKCKSICQQFGHAEEVALHNARNHDLMDGIAVVTGIDYVCRSCAKKLSAAGIRSIVITGYQ